MNQLSIADRRHVEAAQGWCRLHAFADANEELEQVTPEDRVHPDVLEARWQIYANLEKWEGALELANAIKTLVPGEAKGYICTASTLIELGRREEAMEVLRDAATRFPSDEMVLYDLACVCCLLGRQADARAWLAKAVEVGGDEIKKQALDDPDLEHVWTI